MFATVWGLRETRSTISRREILPCRLMTSRTMRRLYGALDCCVVPRLTIDCGGDYIHIQCVNWRESSAAGAWKTLRARRTADGPRLAVFVCLLDSLVDPAPGGVFGGAAMRRQQSRFPAALRSVRRLAHSEMLEFLNGRSAQRE